MSLTEVLTLQHTFLCSLQLRSADCRAMQKLVDSPQVYGSLSQSYNVLSSKVAALCSRYTQHTYNVILQDAAAQCHSISGRSAPVFLLLQRPSIRAAASSGSDEQQRSEQQQAAVNSRSSSKQRGAATASSEQRCVCFPLSQHTLVCSQQFSRCSSSSLLSICSQEQRSGPTSILAFL